MALIQFELKEDSSVQIPTNELEKLYNKHFEATKALMLKKNHDYGEAWRNMSVSTFTDMLLVRINRIKEIENQDGQSVASEGIESNLIDMINYAVFALIRLEE